LSKAGEKVGNFAEAKALNRGVFPVSGKIFVKNQQICWLYVFARGGNTFTILFIQEEVYAR